MAAAKGPVAIRITRPYQTEEQFLAQELETISRTGVMLVGAQQRPDGTVLRFEIALASGTPLLRGEGRVIGFKEAAHGDEPGLSLRFTRLDSKSKALVDKVAAMRDAKRSIPPEVKRSVPPPPPESSRPPSVRPPSVHPPPPARPPSTRPRGVPPPLPPAARRSVAPGPPPAPPPSSSPPKAPIAVESIPELLSTSDVLAAAAEPEPSSPSPSPIAPEPEPEPVAASVPDRASSLDRLRKRPLDADRVAQILSDGAARRR